MREEAALLDHVADAPAELDGIDPQDVRAVDENAATRRLNEAVDHAQRGGLATTRRSDQDAELAIVHGETQLGHGNRAGAVALGHPVERDHQEEGYPPTRFGSPPAGW